MNPYIAILIALVLLVAIVFLVTRSRRANDGVDSFRRQIDALSPEARRPVIDQMYGNTDRSEPRIEPLIEQRPANGPADAADASPADAEAEAEAQSDEDDSDGA